MSIAELFSLRGRVALVTGAVGGIGRVALRTLAEAGAQVVATGRDSAALESLRADMERFGYRCLVEVMDLAVSGSVEAAFRRVLERTRRLDVLVNSAGMGLRGPSLEFSLDKWDLVQTVNLRGLFVCCREAARAMLSTGKGSIINVVSQLGLVGAPERGAYVSAKAGAIGLTRSLALEWATKGIRVNALAPGTTRTAMTAYLDSDPVAREYLLSHIPLRRMAEPEEMAGAVLYLASDASSYVIGQVLAVDGGYTVG